MGRHSENIPVEFEIPKLEPIDESNGAFISDLHASTNPGVLGFGIPARREVKSATSKTPAEKLPTRRDPADAYRRARDIAEAMELAEIAERRHAVDGIATSLGAEAIGGVSQSAPIESRVGGFYAMETEKPDSDDIVSSHEISPKA